MLASWITNHKDITKGFPLIDAMANERHEFLVMTCISMNKKALVQLLKSLFLYKSEYKDVLSDVALTIKEEISAQ
jgi:hypothetical protein